jgi:serine/threonine protein kinase
VAPAGAGGRSQWYQATQLRLNRTVALKFLRPSLAESEFFLECFFQAARQAATIVHPSALPIINIYPAQRCLAVQWCKGRPLRECSGALSPHRTAAVGETVLECLASLHATGRCHGNLSGGNIFLDDSGGVWIDDFFQPPVMDDGERLFRGSHAHMAPELLQTGRMDWRTDVFSLGCILNTLVDGQDRPREMAGIIEAMRALDPSRRGENAAQVREALGRVRRLEESRRNATSIRQQRRRRYRRVPAEFQVSLRRRSATPGETAVILNKIRDIGESGVFVETADELLSIGSILELDFALRGVGGKVHAFGIVRWRSEPPLPSGVGVQFLEVDQAGLRQLREFLDDDAN